MTNLYQQLETPAPPDLPSPGQVYDERLTSQTHRGLLVYFRKLTNILGAVFGPRGGKYLNVPYGAFQDSTSQTAANTTTAYAITFDTTDYANGITLSNSSHLNVSQAGIYNVQFSIQYKNTTNNSQDTEVWFRKNGTDIAKSNSRFGLTQRKSAGDPSHIIAAMNYFINLEQDDYIELMWRPSDVGVSIEKYSAGSSPTRPETPSVIATVSFVSNLSA
ncbi:MAG: hypothetical protein EBR47_09145 [Betaproteobacteria bacterium]|nr:hypothetical protein [Betaproteobacteria bacterium]